MKAIGVVGYGRFGKILTKLLSKKYIVKVYDRNVEVEEMYRADLSEVLNSFIVFISVPIRSFESIIKEISGYKLYNTTIVDVCSVKVFPVEIMKKNLSSNVGILASHPHFGPDSYSPFKELKITLYPVRDMYNCFSELKIFFEGESIRVVEISPDEHDRLAAASQGITHFIGRVLDETGVRSTPINTYGFNELLGVIEQTCNDSWDLFRDLQLFNPYTNEMIDKILSTIDKIYTEIKTEKK